MIAINPYIFKKPLPSRDTLMFEALFENGFTMSSTPQLTPGITGTSITTTSPGKFDSNCLTSNKSSYGSVIYSPYSVSGVSVSFSLWFKVSNIATEGYMIYLGDNTGAQGMILSISHSTAPNKVQFWVNSSATWTNIKSNNDMTSNSWTHVVGIMNVGNRQMKLYINGTLQSDSKTYPEGNPTGGILSIARYVHSTNLLSLGYDGELDNVRVYAKELSQDEINLLYNE